MKRDLFKNWDKKLLAVLSRFPVSVIIAVIYAVLSTWSIHSESYELGDNLIAFFVTGFFLSTAIALALESHLKKPAAYLFNGVLSVLWLSFWLFQSSKFESEWYFTLTAMVLVAFVLGLFFGSYLKKEESLPFWNFTVNTAVKAAISALFAGVLMGGVSLAFAAVDILFKAHLSNKVYMYISICCFVLFMPVYFLSNIPSGEEKADWTIRFNKFLKIFSLYIVLPILLVYTAILYVYLIKIIVQWELPNGWVSWLVSVLGVGGFLSVMLLHPLYVDAKNRFGALFCRYFPLAILPLLALMTIGIFRRFNDYGLTINRLLVMILNVWMYGVAIWLLVTRSKGIRMVFVSFAVIAFFAAVGPWSVFAITRHSITNRLEAVFLKHQMLKNGRIDFTSANIIKPDSATYENMESGLRYLKRNFGMEAVRQYFPTAKNEVSFYAVMQELEDKYGYQKDNDDYYELSPHDLPFTTDGFRYVMYFSVNNSVDTAAKKDGATALLVNQVLTFRAPQHPDIVIPLVEATKRFRLLQKAGKLTNTNETTIKGEKYKLVISSLEGNFKNNTQITRITGVLLY